MNILSMRKDSLSLYELGGIITREAATTHLAMGLYVDVNMCVTVVCV